MNMDKELKKAIEKVKAKLWSWGYGVKDVTKVPGIPYHLLVNEKHRLFVRTSKWDGEKHEDGTPVYEDACDFVACVDGKAVAYMVAKQPMTATLRPYEIMAIEK